MERFVRFGIPPSRMLLQDQGIDVRPFAGLTREPSDRLRLGFAGSLMASKAPHVLLEAVAGLPPGRVSLTIAGDLAPYHGDDSYAGIVRPMLQKRGVEWLGGVAHERVPALLASIDVLVVPSIWIENSPFVIKEAFAAGLPVVASNLGGMAELVQDGRNGLLFTAGDPADLRRVITRLLDEPGLLATLREGIPRVKTIDEDAAWTQALYEEVVREPRARATVESGSVPVPAGRSTAARRLRNRSCDRGRRAELQHAGRHAARGAVAAGLPASARPTDRRGQRSRRRLRAGPLAIGRTASATSAAPATSGSRPGAISAYERRWIRARTWCCS